MSQKISSSTSPDNVTIRIFPWVCLRRACCIILTTFIIGFFFHLYCGRQLQETVKRVSEMLRPQSDFSDFSPQSIRLDRPVTVVTAYYHIKSKHSHEAYVKWMTNFLTKIPCHLYIFTEEKWRPMLQQMRSGFENRTKIVTIPFNNLTLAKRLNFWKKQHGMDHERHRHSPEVYVIWNEKANFLLRAINDNPFESDYFLWTDIGSFRDLEKSQQLTTYPDSHAVSQAVGVDKIFFLQLENFSEEDVVMRPDGLPKHDFRKDVRLGGGIFGGRRDAVVKYSEIFYQTMTRLRNIGRFVGKEQNIMASIAVMYPGLIKLVRPRPYLTAGDPWFYAQFYFSNLSKSLM